jgi:hypothetical protein
MEWNGRIEVDDIMYFFFFLFFKKKEGMKVLVEGFRLIWVSAKLKEDDLVQLGSRLKK